MNDLGDATSRDGGDPPVAMRHAAVFAAGNDAVLIFNRRGRIIDANPAAERMIGHSWPELIGKRPEDIVDPSGARRCLADVFEVVQRGGRWTGEVLFPYPGGSVGISETTVSGIWNEAGSFVGAVSLSRDVTAARRLAAELAEAEQRWRLTLDYAPIGIAVVGLDGRWLRVNAALCRIVGYAEDELLGLTFQDITHPDDLDSGLSLIEQLVSGEIAHYQREKRYLHARGHLVPVSLSAAVVRDEAGTPLHLVCQIEDVTERRSRTERLELLASQDTLTGLANRTSFLDRLDALADGSSGPQPVAVGFADLDGFKNVNDRHGHGAGDQLLSLAGQRITAALRPGDVAARFGGDEFALLLVSVGAPHDVHTIACRLLHALSAPYHLDVATVTVSASLGVALGESGHSGAGHSGRALLSRADAAMYRAKAEGKNTYTIG